MVRDDRHGLYFEDDLEERAGADDASHVQIDDEEDESEDAQRRTYYDAQESQPVPSWPQSYRQSMDIYTHMASPGMPLFSPHSNRPSHSFLSPYPSPYPSLRQRAPVSASFDPAAHPLLSGDSSLPPSGAHHPPASKPPLPPSSAALHKAHPSDEEQLYYFAPSEDLSQGSSLFQAMLNGVNVLAGVGVLSTPYALEQGGWGSLILLFSFAAICCYTGLLLKYCIDAHPGLLTYPDIGWAAFGHTGRLIISVVLYVELYACCVEFVILEGDNLEALFPGVGPTIFGFHLSGRHLFCFLSALCILPTVWLRDLSVLSYVSAGGVLASLTVVLAVMWVGVVDGVGFTQSGPLLRPRGLPVSVGLFGFCFSGHAVFPNIYTSMKDGRQFGRVLQLSFLLCTLIYAGMAIMGFTMFGSAIQAQITLSLPPHYTASKLAVLTTIVNPFTKYALTMTPVALCLEELLPMDPKLPSYRRASLAIRTALVASTVCVALLIPFFGYVMAFIGSFLSMTVSIILPCACYLRIMGRKATYLQTFVCSTIILIGLVCAIAGTYSSVAGIVGEFGT